MDDSATARMRFQTHDAPLALEAAFDGGRITSDGGLCWLAEADRDLGLCEAIARRVPERRGPSVRHPLAMLVRQRVYQIACGYEDQNDSDALRKDPLLKLVLGSLPQTGADLASQPTISRLENAPDARACLRIARELGELYIRERGKEGAPPKRVLLDFDATDAPTHGDQEGSYYHGYYGTHMYHPLVVFDGETDQLIAAVLRAGNTHASRGALSVLKRVVRRLREAWGQGLEIEIRADAGFAVPAVYEWCEQEGVGYTIGLVSNPRLERLAEPLLERAERESEARDAGKVRLVSDASYRAESWERSRRVVYKAEVLEKGTNTRFVVTSKKKEEPKKLYDWYVKRGEAEGWIKDFKRALKADRLSCHRFWANQFRLLLHAAAYWLLDELRRRLVAAGASRMQLDTLRLRFVKIGGRVRQLLTKVRLHLASGHPGQRLWHALASATREHARE
ncbi:MAG: IS1380 family transposase [Actinomycetota bacterium]|nr:IS1380 family transposase [Actinomycetota bacterium]